MMTKLEFVPYWMSSTGVNMDMTLRLFKIFDADNNGVFGDDAEKKSIYTAFDYNSK